MRQAFAIAVAVPTSGIIHPLTLATNGAFSEEPNRNSLLLRGLVTKSVGERSPKKPEGICDRRFCLNLSD